MTEKTPVMWYDDLPHPPAMRRGTNDLSIFNEQTHYGLLPYQDAIVLDLGAHIGAFALYALLAGAAQVYSYEPELDNYHLLHRNMYPYHKYSFIKQAAVAPDTPDHGSARVLFLSKQNTGMHTLLGVTDDEIGNFSEFTQLVETVSLTRVIALAKTGAGQTPLIAKIDIEGMEYHIDLPASLKSLDAVAIEYHFNRPGATHDRAKVLHDAIIDAGLSIVTKQPDFTHAHQTIGIYQRMKK